MLTFKNDQASFAVEGDRVVLRLQQPGGEVYIVNIYDEQPLKSLLLTCMVALKYEVATLSANGKLFIKAVHGPKGEA